MEEGSERLIFVCEWLCGGKTGVVNMTSCACTTIFAWVSSEFIDKTMVQGWRREYCR